MASSPVIANDDRVTVDMKNDRTTIARYAAALAACGLIAVALFAGLDTRAQQIPVGGNGASDFNSLEYFAPPYQQQIKRRLSGAQAQSLPGGLLLVKQVKIEVFDVNGKLQMSAHAPECIYDPINGVANSPGEVHMQSGDGAVRTDGEGFLWRQSDSYLTISNQVQTVVEKMSTLPQ